MISKIMIMGAAALALAGVAPALAQSTSDTGQSGSMQSGGMQSGGTQGGGMQSGGMQTGGAQSGSMTSSSSMPKMTKAQMASMKKCQAMSSDMAAKNKTCAKMMKMHPEMMGSGTM